MLLKFIRWMYGYVIFEITGNKTERLINSCVREKINLWDIRKNKNCLSSRISINDFKNLEKISKKFEFELKIKKKIGFPVFIKKNKNKSWVLITIFIFMILGYLGFLRIWIIEIKGIENIEKSQILNILSETGIFSGSIRKKINIHISENEIMKKLPVSWVAINLHGVKLEVLIKEKIITPEMVQKNEYCNIKSACDGQIERIETYKGTTLVSVGDTVIKNQLLISGVVEDYFGNNYFVKADGKVFAKTKKELFEKTDLNREVFFDTGKLISKFKIKIFNLEIPISFDFNSEIDENYRAENEEHNFLCVNIVKEKYYEQKIKKIEVNIDEVKEELKEKIAQIEQEKFHEIDIIDKNNNFYEENNTLCIKSEYVCIENISKVEEILLE
ncbi:MAG: sporulation protein YqfD [Candidatus Paraimprobicoccus trichonymphae]|uniref:Sporulation protein YqfD n=1 Tax=Candidatus Paraimprobicoccus trichonymphae TaxID=3033793 RepID=A0AA48L060_9FIRM|nr:MAG: sporulation protein YqfD [Candidatus Paraimprobicoccus trichonymphae]